MESYMFVMFIDVSDGFVDVYYVKSYHIVHFKLVLFVIYELYLNEAVKNICSTIDRTKRRNRKESLQIWRL